jgi:restriction endonuclease S subunit
MPTSKLKDIADIQLGLVLARKEADEDSPHRYTRLTLKSLGEDGEMNPAKNENFTSSEELNPAFLTQTGTILMKLFAPLNPVLITEETTGYVIPSQIAIITAREAALPEYLYLYLSLEATATQLLSQMTGTVLRALTLKTLSEFEIALPPMKKQQSICNLHKLYRKKYKLQDELIARERLLMQSIVSAAGEP